MWLGVWGVSEKKAGDMKTCQYIYTVTEGAHQSLVLVANVQVKTVRWS